MAVAAKNRPLLPRAALALLAALVLLLVAGARAAADVATCKALVETMGGATGLQTAAPNCDPGKKTTFKTSACCSQLRTLLAKSGPQGRQCLCDKTVFDTFLSTVNVPGMPSAAIPVFLSICRIPTPGTKGC